MADAAGWIQGFPKRTDIQIVSCPYLCLFAAGYYIYIYYIYIYIHCNTYLYHPSFMNLQLQNKKHIYDALIQTMNLCKNKLVVNFDQGLSTHIVFICDADGDIGVFLMGDL